MNHTRLILRCESVRLLVFVPLSTIKPSVGSFDAAVERKSGRSFACLQFVHNIFLISITNQL